MMSKPISKNLLGLISVAMLVGVITGALSPNRILRRVHRQRAEVILIDTLCAMRWRS